MKQCGKPWLQECWVIPLEANGEFFYHMEDVKSVYTRPYDSRYPMVCFDETSKQLTQKCSILHH